jgi:hypothetical protein
MAWLVLILGLLLVGVCLSHDEHQRLSRPTWQPGKMRRK